MTALLLAAVLARGLELTSDALTLEPGANVASARGSVHAVTREFDIRCEQARAIFTPAPDGGHREVERLELEGTVHAVRLGDQLTVDAARATWSKAEHTLVLSGEARALRGADMLQGARMALDLDSDSIAVDEPRVMLERRPGEPARIEAGHLAYRSRGSRAVFTRSVRMKQGTLETSSDRLEAIIDPPDRAATPAPRPMQLSGSVTIRKGTTRAQAARAVYEPEPGRLELEGRPRLEQEGHRLDGERIVYDLASGKARVERAVAKVRGGR